MHSAPPRRDRTDVRFLEGPNLFYPRPAGVLEIDVRGLPAGRRARTAVRKAIRELTRAAGKRRVAVRIRPGDADTQLQAAVPWVTTGGVEALGRALDDCLDALAAGTGYPERVRAGAAAMAATPPGRRPQPITPTLPVVAVTGTNGKTTTSRVIATIARTAGLRTGLTSTHGVFVDDELIDDGDYSGPGGARLALAQPGLQLLVAETARGGILRRGIAFTGVEVGVVTNVSPDHLGSDGIRTVDQLAEVKATVARLATPTGWAVLNADDPRVFDMRTRAVARPWVFSRDADSPNVRTALNEGGRATVVEDGALWQLESGMPAVRIVALDELAWTLFGANRANVENALAAASAALALGLPPDQVAAGLRAFRLDEASSRRFNIFSMDGRTVIYDMAHNEASVQALLEASHAFQGPGRRLWVALGAPGNRGADVHETLALLAALDSDGVAFVDVPGYEGGHTFAEVTAWGAAGLARAGKEPLGAFARTADAVDALLALSAPGDVLAVTAHEDYDGAVAHLLARGGRWDTPDDLRRKLGEVRVGNR